MRFGFIQEHVQRFSVRLMCQIMGVSTSGYYAWRQRSLSQRAQGERVLLGLIRAAVKQGRKTYGYRRVHALVKEEFACSRPRVARLMRENGLQPRQKRRFRKTTQSGHHLPVAPNLLFQDFSTSVANQKWVADITYIPTDQGWLYLSTIEDLFSRLIVGWSMASALNDLLTRQALLMALGRRRPMAGMIHHSDQGRQYASGAYRELLAQAGIVQSMSRRGNALDNAPMESFYSRLKNELIHHRHFCTRAEARRDIFEYIEVFYNRQRLHSALGYRSPADFEALHNVT